MGHLEWWEDKVVQDAVFAMGVGHRMLQGAQEYMTILSLWPLASNEAERSDLEYFVVECRIGVFDTKRQLWWTRHLSYLMKARKSISTYA